jgi:hypothetical protein
MKIKIEVYTSFIMYLNESLFILFIVMWFVYLLICETSCPSQTWVLTCIFSVKPVIIIDHLAFTKSTQVRATRLNRHKDLEAPLELYRCSLFGCRINHSDDVRKYIHKETTYKNVLPKKVSILHLSFTVQNDSCLKPRCTVHNIFFK